MATKKKSKDGNLISTNSSTKNAKKTNYVMAKIIKTRQNSRCRVFGEETIKHIVSECDKLVKKGVQDRVWLCVKGDPLGIVQEIQI